MERLKTYRILWFILRNLVAFCFPLPLSLGFTVLDRVDARPLSSKLDDSSEINPERQSLYNHSERRSEWRCHTFFLESLQQETRQNSLLPI